MPEYSEKQKDFINRNRDILVSIFKADLDEIKDKILTTKPEERDVLITFANYFKEWIEAIELKKERENEKRQKKPIKNPTGI